MTRNSFGARLLATAALACAIVLASATAAWAHDSLISSSPSDGETVTTPLTRIELTFSDSLLNLGGIDSAFAIQVSDAAGGFYGSGCVDLSDATVSTDLTLGEPGSYQVRWQVVSADGHSISDGYTFDYAPPAGTEAAPAVAVAPACGNEAAPTASPETSEKTATPVDSGLILGLVIGAGALAVIAAVLFLAFRRSRQPH